MSNNLVLYKAIAVVAIVFGAVGSLHSIGMGVAAFGYVVGVAIIATLVSKR